MYYLGMLQGQHEELLKKTRPIIAMHDSIRKGELELNERNTLVGLEDFVEAVKKYQSNCALLLAYCFMWRNDWKSDLPEKPKA